MISHLGLFLKLFTPMCKLTAKNIFSSCTSIGNQPSPICVWPSLTISLVYHWSLEQYLGGSPCSKISWIVARMWVASPKPWYGLVMNGLSNSLGWGRNIGAFLDHVCTLYSYQTTLASTLGVFKCFLLALWGWAIGVAPQPHHLYMHVTSSWISMYHPKGCFWGPCSCLSP